MNNERRNGQERERVHATLGLLRIRAVVGVLLNKVICDIAAQMGYTTKMIKKDILTEALYRLKTTEDAFKTIKTLKMQLDIKNKAIQHLQEELSSLISGQVQPTPAMQDPLDRREPIENQPGSSTSYQVQPTLGQPIPANPKPLHKELEELLKRQLCLTTLPPVQPPIDKQLERTRREISQMRMNSFPYSLPQVPQPPVEPTPTMANPFLMNFLAPQMTFNNPFSIFGTQMQGMNQWQNTPQLPFNMNTLGFSAAGVPNLEMLRNFNAMPTEPVNSVASSIPPLATNPLMFTDSERVDLLASMLSKSVFITPPSQPPLNQPPLKIPKREVMENTRRAPTREVRKRTLVVPKREVVETMDEGQVTRRPTIKREPDF